MEKKIKNLLTVLITATFALAFTSCGNKQENAVKDQIKLMNEYADEFDKDPKSEKLAKIDKKITALEERMKGISEEDAKKLMSEYGKEMGAAAGRYMKAKLGTTIGGMGKMLEGVNVEGFDLKGLVK